MKHAYLIIAHNEFSILEKQLRLLDDPRNDFYIHIDKKVKNFPFEKIRHFVNHSNIYFVKRVNVIWGDFSMVKCELNLLKAAVKGKYQYYHLLSGVDMPLKSNDEIHYFFDKFSGNEFVHFCCDDEAKLQGYRMYKYHCMWARTLSSNFIEAYIKKITKEIFSLPTKIGFKRKENRKIPISYGAQWFSITHELAQYVLSKRKWIYKHFKFTCCADEHFLQMLVKQSEFKESLFNKQFDGNYFSCLRYIDWNRGNPYVFRTEDFELLINSPFLFARKFSVSTDDRIVDMIFQYIAEKNCTNIKL